MKKTTVVHFICLVLVLVAFAGCEGMATLFHGEKPTAPSGNPDDNSNPGGGENPGTPPPSIPGIPSGVQTAAVSTSEIMVFWTASTGADSYIVFYGTETAGEQSIRRHGKRPVFSDFRVTAGNHLLHYRYGG
jgi:hypothetical protein